MTKRGLFFGVFLASLVSTVAYLSQPSTIPNIGETPLLTIELGGDFSKKDTRRRVLRLEERLRKSGAFEFVGGPGRFRCFVPGDQPVPKTLDSLKDKDWLQLAPLLKISENAQVHFFNAKLSHCVIRCVPKTEKLVSAKEIETLLGDAQQWDSFRVQAQSFTLTKSSDLGASWGNQALSVRIREKPGYFFNIGVYRIIATVLQRIRGNSYVVGARSLPDFVADIRRAQGKDSGALLSQRDYDTLRPLLFLQSPELFEAPCLSRDGATLSFVILTRCPNAERGEFVAWLRSQLSEIGDGGSIDGLPMLRGG